VVLAPAAAALAGSAGLGVAAFEIDLPGYNFGWRQAASAAAGICLALASIPWFVAAGSGRWDMPSADASSVLAFLPNAAHGDYRVLWVGHPDALPLAGRQLEPGFAYGTSFDGQPVLADDWATGSPGAAGTLASDLLLVQGRLTTRLGHLLAPAGVRFIVVPNHVGPATSGGRPVPVPGALLAGLGLQTDLQAVSVGDPNYTVYENASWAPVRSTQPTGTTAGAAGLRQLEETDISTAKPVLTGGSSESASGRVPSGATLFVGSSRSGGWHLTAGGHTVSASPAFGWAMKFSVPGASGADVGAHLGYSAPFWVRGGDVLQILLWAGALFVIYIDRRARSERRDGGEQADPMWFVPAASAPPRRRTTRLAGPVEGGRPARRPRPDRDGGPARPRPEAESDEVWSGA
jgi:hypothetical protein